MGPTATTTVLVTGANRGIGLDVVRRFLRDGAKVLMTSRKLQDGEKVAAALKAELGDVENRLVVLELDQSQEDSIQKLAAVIKAKYTAQINILINNAGILKVGWTQDSFDTVMGTNAWGVMNLTEALLPLLADGANIVNVTSEFGRTIFLGGNFAQSVPSASSVQDLRSIVFDSEGSTHGNVVSAMDFATQAGKVVAPGQGWPVPAYNLSKAVLNRYTQLLTEDPRLTSRSIRINSVCPGWVKTDMGSDAAPRTIEEGSKSVYLAAMSKASGSFTRDGAPVAW